MNKKIVIYSILIIILSFLIGLYVYKNYTIDNNKEIAEELIDDECTKIEEEFSTLKVNAEEIKISPKAKLITQVLYTECNHLVEKTETILDEELINLTKEEFRNKYKEWEIKKFTSSEIIIYKEINDFCNEHYIVKENEGYVAIYKINKNGDEELERVTDILLEYLTNSDIQNIKKGIKVYSKEDLNKTIEDFE